jgi:hypothetical protein
VDKVRSRHAIKSALPSDILLPLVPPRQALAADSSDVDALESRLSSDLAPAIHFSRERSLLLFPKRDRI